MIKMKLGITSPDKLLKKGVPAYERTNPPVTGVHIGIVVAVILVIWYFVGGKFGLKGSGDNMVTQNFANPNLPNSAYPGYASYSGWFAAQYNQLGATAGALYGEGN